MYVLSVYTRAAKNEFQQQQQQQKNYKVTHTDVGWQTYTYATRMCKIWFKIFLSFFFDLIRDIIINIFECLSNFGYLFFDFQFSFANTTKKKEINVSRR